MTIFSFDKVNHTAYNVYMKNKSLHLDRDWLYQKYIVEELSTYQIGKIVNRNPKNVYNKLKDFGIPTRSRAETIQKNAWWNIGKDHWNKGKHRSEKTKNKISKTRKERKIPGMQGKSNPMYGKRSHNWKGGVTPERQRIYATGLWKEIAKTVFERDLWLCQKCGKQNNNLHTHHKKAWADYIENRFDLDNLVTLCKKCHHWIHSKKNINKEFIL